MEDLQQKLEELVNKEAENICKKEVAKEIEKN
jgi:hypothetical protein